MTFRSLTLLRAMAAGAVCVPIFGTVAQSDAAQKVSKKEGYLPAAGSIVKPAPSKKLLLRTNGEVFS